MNKGGPQMSKTQFSVKTPQHACMVDITGEVARIVKESGASAGLATVFIPHTTAGVTIQENADPDVVHDFLETLERIVPWRADFYEHSEGNSAAHVKSSLVGCSAQVPIEGGRLALGTWQGIYFCEFDGPRTRQVVVVVS
jgi:secondary thiamine-phosphate synthase enzyme